MSGAVRGNLRIGSTFAGYRIDSILGRGGMGVVYLTRDERLGRPVALKVIVPELAGDPQFRERFLSESRLAASLDHSHVIPIYEAGEVGGELFLAMRYVDGTTLRERLSGDEPPDAAQGVELCSQVADALDAAHDRGLVHRDVKPANVLIADESGREHCYLCDFGLSQRAGGHETGFTGTVAYTAPEQIRSEAIDGRVDQYSLACVLCECLTGQPPFPGPNAMATLFAHLNDEPPSLHDRRPELPAAIDPVVAQALAKEPAERYPSCRDFAAAARQALGIDDRTLSRRALLLAAGGAAAITAAAAIPAILLTRGDGATPAIQPKPLLPLTSDAVLRIDPAGTVTDTLDVPSGPGPIVFGESSVWLADKGRKMVSRIDPATSAIIDEIDTTERGDPSALAVGEGAVWIFATDWTARRLRRYDLRTRQWSDVDLNGINSENLVVAYGALWSVCDEILRIDPATGHIDAQLDTGMQGKLVAAGTDGIWFAANQQLVASGESRVWRIDPKTNDLGPPIDFDGTVADIAAGAGGVWTLILEDDLVRRIDPMTLEISEAFRVGRIPESLAAAQGAVWAGAGRDGTLTRYDLASADLKTIEIGGAPRDLAIGGGAVWAAVEVT